MYIDVREAICEAIAEEMRKDDKVFVIGEEIGEYQGAYKTTKGLLKEFGPQRIIDSPITEHAFAGLGIGAAFAGLRPIVEFMTFNFAMQAIDQIINSAAKTHYMSGGKIKVPIVFRGPNGTSIGVGAQHSQCYAAWYSHVPGLKVIAPYCASDHKNLLKLAIQDDNPVIFLENELLYSNKDSTNQPTTSDITQIGKAKIIQHGTDVSIISFSYTTGIAIKAVEELALQGINAELIDLSTIKPLDIESIIKSFKKTNRMVIVEAGWCFAGIAAEIIACIQEHAFDYIDAPLSRISAENVPTPYARNLELEAIPSYQKIIETVKKIL